MNDDNKGSSGMTFTSLLGLTFVILKLCKVIDWSWWLVLLPFYFPLLVFIVVTVGLFFSSLVLKFFWWK